MLPDMTVSELLADVRQFMVDFNLDIIITALIIIALGVYVYRTFIQKD